MTLYEKIKELLRQIEELKSNPDPDKKLPQNSYYLNENDILCCEREKGESRYPYDSDGLVVWAKSSGYIDACESTFAIFKTVNFAEDPSISFFAGIPLENGEFFPVSVLGANRQLFEPLKVDRYVVYSFRCAYYIADTDNVTFAVRLHVSEDKHIHFSYVAINKTEETVPFYMASSIEAILRFAETEAFWDRMTKYGEKYDCGSYMLRSYGDSLVINIKAEGGNITDEYHTVAKSDFLGPKGRGLTNALALRTGEFAKEHKKANTTDIPMASDIVHYELAAGESIRREFDLSYYHGVEKANEAVGAPVDTDAIDAALFASEEKEKHEFDKMVVEFNDWNGSIRAKVLNRFIRNVQKQVSFCALGKNYAGPHIGIRDVFQQLESSLIWHTKESRDKIITALNYILEDGRPPRQFSLPATPDMIPDMDLRKYIDQGVWVISTIYTYLCYTDDYSILDEECSYYVANEDNTWIERKSDIRDTVLDHMVKIMDYLISKLDREYGTNCLRALTGDWNDAIDGLGKPLDQGKDFGSGVTVMASLQLYQNLREMTELLTRIGKYTDKLELYDKTSKELVKGLFEYAIDYNEDGERRIIHGWGDKISYKLGSWNDADGVARRSTTANSFWVLSGMINNDTSLAKEVLENFAAVDSIYGIKTFDVAFPPSLKFEAGRIAGITDGTYENNAAYVHASMFAIMALFSLGQSKKAWEEMEKSAVISHENCTMTSFAMPNSYCSSEEYEMEGDSMGDWYTGSGTVLIKSLIKFGFGICPTLDGLCLQTPATMPCSSCKLQLTVKGHPITVIYNNTGADKRTVKINGSELCGTYDDLMKTDKFFIATADIADNATIEIID